MRILRFMLIVLARTISTRSLPRTKTAGTLKNLQHILVTTDQNFRVGPSGTKSRDEPLLAIRASDELCVRSHAERTQNPTCLSPNRYKDVARSSSINDDDVTRNTRPSSTL